MQLATHFVRSAVLWPHPEGGEGHGGTDLDLNTRRFDGEIVLPNDLKPSFSLLHFDLRVGGISLSSFNASTDALLAVFGSLSPAVCAVFCVRGPGTSGGAHRSGRDSICAWPEAT
jgi:hypothetical protein